MRATVLSLLFVPLIGCAPPAPRETADLVDPSLFRILDADEDPFPTHRAAAKRLCTGPGFGEDLGVLDIDTNTCAYVSASQPSLADAQPGDQLHLLAWHQALASTDPDARGHMAVLLDGEVLWEIDVAIPASAEVYESFFDVPELIPEGTDVVVHVHNHGGNTWRLGHLRAVPPEDQAP
ncbi:MAG: hypothetical protein KDA24_22980 [Deltaproteobacteria bacterium]|nr:hypothetical protein [Deltaproteobacteria bacterium]